MSNIVIDVTRLVARTLEKKIPTGVDRVGLAYISHFQERAMALVRFGKRWVVLTKKDSNLLFKALLQPDKNFARRARFMVGKNYIFNWHQNINLATLVNVTHDGLNDISYLKKINKNKLKPLFYLHDVIPITYPEYCRPGDQEKHQKRLHTMLSTQGVIIVNSEDTLNCLKNYANQHNYSLPRYICSPIALSITPTPKISSKRPIDQPYFVILGTIEGRKNHLLLLNIWRELYRQFGLQAPRLIIIGRRGWECEHVIDMLDRCEGIKNLVIEKPNCDDSELASWLLHAQSLLFPSFAEGFGIPLIEALYLGVPVIASDLKVFHEIAGDIPEYAHPLDALMWKDLIIDYTSKSSARAAAQRERIWEFKSITWPEHFTKVEDFMKNLGLV